MSQEKHSLQSQKKQIEVGDIVTIDLQLEPENDYVPTPLFDTSGILTFVVGNEPWGNYLPGLHHLLLNHCLVDDAGAFQPNVVQDEETISIDAGWGERSSDLIITISKSKLRNLPHKVLDNIQVGHALHLKNNVKVLVTEVSSDSITVDANPPLAGTSFLCHRLRILEVNPLPTQFITFQDTDTPACKFAITSFSLGCFWAAQLAFDRLPGVVGTKVGYVKASAAIDPNVSNDDDHHPTYEQVCQGGRHVETVTVVYDTTTVSYYDLMELAWERLQLQRDSMGLSTLFDASASTSYQYQNGFYYHCQSQRKEALKFLALKKKQQDTTAFPFGIQLRPATQFYDAESNHQHYLLKGGQSAKKNAKETIRCFG